MLHAHSFRSSHSPSASPYKVFDYPEMPVLVDVLPDGLYPNYYPLIRPFAREKLEPSNSE